MWTRPGLDRRSRYLIAISGAACEGGRPEIIDGYVRGALKLGASTLSELREAALHLAVYAGWSSGTAIDAAVTRVASELGLPAAENPAIRAEPWDPQQRIKEGTANFTSVMIFPPPPPIAPYFEGGIINFVFGEMWMRPGLDQRARRWVTLVGVAQSSSTTPIRTHTYAAMASGNATRPGDARVRSAVRHSRRLAESVGDASRRVRDGRACDRRSSVRDRKSGTRCQQPSNMKGKAAIVTGAASGLGRATALKLASGGRGRVSRRRERCGIWKRPRSSCARSGVRCILHATDLSAPRELRGRRGRGGRRVRSARRALQRRWASSSCAMRMK